MAITIDIPLPLEVKNCLQEKFLEGIKQNQQDFDDWKARVETLLPIRKEQNQ